MKDILILTVDFVLPMLTNHWIYGFIAQKIFTHHLPIIWPSLDVQFPVVGGVYIL